MKLEEAIPYLRDGKRIYRKDRPERGSLCGEIEGNKIYGSFYLTIWDVLSDDWEWKEK